MTTLPSFAMYGNYRSTNYGWHALRFDLPGFSVWFSYRTPVAFQVDYQPVVCRQNEWGPTTGKYLNLIQRDKKERVSGEEFERVLAEACEREGVKVPS